MDSLSKRVKAIASSRDPQSARIAEYVRRHAALVTAIVEERGGGNPDDEDDALQSILIALWKADRIATAVDVDAYTRTVIRNAVTSWQRGALKRAESVDVAEVNAILASLRAA
jgi:DNA-directed RNA polymerase specialized sigma24 family protein